MVAGGHFDELSGRRMSALAAIPTLYKDKPKIDIQLDDQQAGCFVPSYTTLDRIQGHASIVCPQDTLFDAINVIFQGCTKTYVEKIASTAPTTPRTHAFHNFLRLVQPLDDVELPEDNILRAGQTYTIPFTFVVPERLLPQACTHAKDNPAIPEAHICLPPSLGDPMMAGDGNSLLNDLAPATSMISYGIRVIVTRRDAGNKPRAVADGMKKLRIIPATEEQPPLTVDENMDDYFLQRSKKIKKGMFQGKVGTLTMTAQQPTPLRLPPARGAASSTGATAIARIDLTFEPRTPTAKPPRLGSLWVKLKCATFFATAPMRDFPSKSAPFVYDSQRGIYMETVPLSGRRVEGVQWTKHDGLARRDSGISVPCSPTTTSPSLPASPPLTPGTPDTPAGLHYTAHIVVPVDLPTGSKTFVPTFHSCLVSRIYALDIALSASAGASTVAGLVGANSMMHLKLPLQIVQAGNPAAIPAGPDADTHAQRTSAATTGAAADDADASSGMADLTLRGARGSVFRPPRWGSVAWGATNAQQLPPGAAGDARRGSSPDSSHSSSDDLVDADAPESRRDMLAALEDETATSTHRTRTRDDPPGYTAFNGVATRARGVNIWT